MRVLIVEDSLRLQTSLRKGLERLGYGVDLAADGAAGLSYAMNNEYDVVVLDLMLPVLDGLTALRKLRAIEGSGSRSPRASVALLGWS